MVIPADNPLTKEKVELGRLLFFDKRLSQDNTIACANCHLAKFAFTDGKPVSTGIRGQKGGRSAPASFNRVFSSAQFWDGRAATLEEQSVGPFTNPIEHGFANYDVMMAKMMKIPGYRKLFMQVFGEDKITIDNVGKAIASFQRTVLSGNSPADRFDQGQEEGAISAAGSTRPHPVPGESPVHEVPFRVQLHRRKVPQPRPRLGRQQSGSRAVYGDQECRGHRRI